MRAGSALRLDIDDLPDDPSALKETLREMQDSVRLLDADCDLLEHRLNLELARRYGRRSERRDADHPDQGYLFGEPPAEVPAESVDDDASGDPQEEASEPLESSTPKKRKGRNGRRRLPGHLPREETVLELERRRLRVIAAQNPWVRSDARFRRRSTTSPRPCSSGARFARSTRARNATRACSPLSRPEARLKGVSQDPACSRRWWSASMQTTPTQSPGVDPRPSWLGDLATDSVGLGCRGREPLHADQRRTEGADIERTADLYRRHPGARAESRTQSEKAAGRKTQTKEGGAKGHSLGLRWRRKHRLRLHEIPLERWTAQVLGRVSRIPAVWRISRIHGGLYAGEASPRLRAWR